MTPTIPQPRILLPLFTNPVDDPEGWNRAEAQGAAAVAIINLPLPQTPEIQRARPPRWAALGEGIERLVAAGVHPLGHVSLGYATRPEDQVLDEISRWSALPLVGAFLDHAPAGPYQIGPVIHAVRAARRAGLGAIVLNPGVPVDPIYRRLDATICSFEGSWSEYLSWSGEGTAKGDGHLVFGVPPQECEVARALIVARRAGLMLVTECDTAYDAEADLDDMIAAAR